MTTSCELCSEIETGRMPAARASRLPRRHHVPVGSALIFAALTPLRAGHVLVIPRQHATSSASLPRDARDDVTAALDLLAKRWCDDGQLLLAFEHGIRPGGTGGCGIEHAHVHALPVTPEESDRVLEAARALAGERTWHGSPLHEDVSHASYVHVGAWRRRADFGAIGEFASQTLRRLIAPEIRSKRDDWRLPSGWEDMSTTDRALAQRFPSAAGNAVGHAA